MLNRVVMVGRLCSNGQFVVNPASDTLKYTGEIELVEWVASFGYYRHRFPVTASNSLASLLRGRCNDLPMVYVEGRLASTRPTSASDPAPTTPAERVVVVVERVKFLSPTGAMVRDPGLDEWARIPGTDHDENAKADPPITTPIEEQPK